MSKQIPKPYMYIYLVNKEENNQPIQVPPGKVKEHRVYTKELCSVILYSIQM